METVRPFDGWAGRPFEVDAVAGLDHRERESKTGRGPAARREPAPKKPTPRLSGETSAARMATLRSEHLQAPQTGNNKEKR